MRVLAAVLLSLAAADHDENNIQQDAPFTCPGGFDDDCIEGYTSLLQESVKLMGHQQVVGQERLSQHHSGKGRSAIAKKGASSLAEHSERSDMHGRTETGARGQQLLASLSLLHLSLICAAVLALVAFFVWRSAQRQAEQGEHEHHRRRSSFLTMLVNHPENTEEMEQRIHDTLDEDTYSLAIALLVRDLRSISLGEGRQSLKASRVAFSIGLIILTVSLTISILVCVKQFVTPSQVADIRDAYAKFEEVMYNNHTYLNANGKKRGMPGYFDASLFDTLSDDDRQNACNIPFSQLNFLVIILGIWSIAEPTRI